MKETSWVFCADPIISGQHCQPTHILPAACSWWSFLRLAGASLLPPRGALGLRIWLEVEPPFVCDKTAYQQELLKYAL